MGLNLRAPSPSPTPGGSPTTPVHPLGLIAPAALIVGTVFVFGPATLYRGNAPEIRAAFGDILSAYALPAAVTLGLLVAPAVLLGGRWRSAYATLLVAVGILLWFQGNVLVWDYGVLDGRDIPWGSFRGRAAIDLVIWGAVGTAAVLLNQAAVHRIGIALATALLGVQSAGLALDWPKPAAQPGGIEIAAASLEYSRTFNIVHVLLDAFQTDVFGEILERDELARELDGFVWFRENLAVSPTTVLALPAIFSGRVYANDVPLDRFYKDTVGEHAFYSALRDRGYRVHLHLAQSHYACLGRWTTCHVIKVPRHSDSAVLLDLSLFRHAPQQLKRLVFNRQRWLVQQGWGERPAAAGHQQFFADYAARIHVGGEAPAYHFVHLLSPHFPVVTDERCTYTGPVEHTRASYRGQATCVARLLLRFLARLRDLGVYDTSAIIVQSDHGAGFGVALRDPPGAGATSGDIPSEVGAGQLAGGALAVLAVKPPHRRGRMVTSIAPTSLTDIPGTVLSFAGVGGDSRGRSVLEIGPAEARRRRYNFYRWSTAFWTKPFLSSIQQFEVAGSPYDAAAWRLRGVLAGRAPVRKARRLDLGTSESAEYLVRGWGDDERLADGTTAAWGLGRSSTVRLSLPPDRNLRLTARLRAYPVSNRPQQITVVVDDAVAGHWEVRPGGRLREFTTLVPRAVSRPPTSTIEFRFSEVKPPDSSGGSDPRALAVLFDWISIEPSD
jgi:hypothetical protein